MGEWTYGSIYVWAAPGCDDAEANKVIEYLTSVGDVHESNPDDEGKHFLCGEWNYGITSGDGVDALHLTAEHEGNYGFDPVAAAIDMSKVCYDASSSAGYEWDADREAWNGSTLVNATTSGDGDTPMLEASRFERFKRENNDDPAAIVAAVQAHFNMFDNLFSEVSA